MKISHILTTAFIGLIFAGCREVETARPDDLRGNFDALWTILDEHYCFFEEKGVDWNAMHDKYAAYIDEETNYVDLFNICGAMLNELRDGHTNLSSAWNTSYYRNWWSDYPQNFDLRLVEEHYLGFNYNQVSGMMYGLLEGNVGYLRYGSFSSSVGELNLDYVLVALSECDGLIIDIRDNGGGELTNVGTFVARFIDERVLAGYIQHKTGPGHDDFSEPYAYYYDPADETRIKWKKPVVVLTNRSTFSAANNFVSVMQYLPQVKIVGATTGGGSGIPFSSEIPIGWAVRFSASPVYDREMRLTENGIEPSPGCAVDLDPELALQGRDTMLDFAIDMLRLPPDNRE